MTIREAREYINFNIKEGILDEDKYFEMSDAQLIEFAEEMDARSDAWFDLQREYEGGE